METNEATAAPRPAYVEFETAHNTYYAALNAAADKLQRAMAEARSALWSALIQLQQSRSCEANNRAWAEYERGVKTAMKENNPQTIADEAFATYLRAVQQAFSKIEPQKLDPATLAAIGRSLITVASHTAQTQRLFQVRA